MKTNINPVLMLILQFLLLTASAQISCAEQARKIMDNSFLLEEAYNQETRVIQHIQSYQYLKNAKDWFYTFTQEWPVTSQTHQLSYTVPLNRLYLEDKNTKLGDIALNYRYQAVFKDGKAFAPRVSLLLPTGDSSRGYGTGTFGYQINLPVSVELSDTLVGHWNLGSTFTPESKERGGATADTVGFNYGASLIWLISENFNFMMEGVGNSGETVQPDATKVRTDTFYLSPGFRGAINFKSGLQVVPGIAAPIGVGPSEREYGILLYLSFEHPF